LPKAYVELTFELFGFSLGSDKFLTLKNAKTFAFYSLNRKFTLPLRAKEKIDLS